MVTCMSMRERGAAAIGTNEYRAAAFNDPYHHEARPGHYIRYYSVLRRRLDHTLSYNILADICYESNLQIIQWYTPMLEQPWRDMNETQIDRCLYLERNTRRHQTPLFKFRPYPSSDHIQVPTISKFRSYPSSDHIQVPTISIVKCSSITSLNYSSYKGSQRVRSVQSRLIPPNADQSR
jgi:hypothetical protein